MRSVEELLAQRAPEIEAEVQRRLTGLFGGMLRAYLPQTWVFRTEEGTASIRVDAAGKATVTNGAAEGADVTVAVGHAKLEAALTSGSRGAAAPGPVHVETHTAKGRAAFSFLRDRFGLGAAGAG
jgi:hypothetical protein